MQIAMQIHSQRPQSEDYLDSAENLLDSATRAKNAESSDKIKSKKPYKSFCYFWLIPKVESPLPLKTNLPSNAESARNSSLRKYSAQNDNNFVDSAFFIQNTNSSIINKVA